MSHQARAAFFEWSRNSQSQFSARQTRTSNTLSFDICIAFLTVGIVLPFALVVKSFLSWRAVFLLFFAQAGLLLSYDCRRMTLLATLFGAVLGTRVAVPPQWKLTGGKIGLAAPLTALSLLIVESLWRLGQSKAAACRARTTGAQ